MLPCPPQLKNYPGAKEGAGMYQTIINQLPPHKTYIEPFLGSGTILRYKKLAGRTIGIDYASSVVEKWQDISMGSKWSELTMGTKVEFYCECSIAYFENLAASVPADKDILIYADPPYPIGSRASQERLYEKEMTDKQHERLLEALNFLSSTSSIAISTYTNKIYRKALSNWRCLPFNSQTRKGKSVELLYMNYDEPTELHDYRYLGIDMTDRQRIKRKIERKVQDWKGLPILERKALIQALQVKKLLS